MGTTAYMCLKLPEGVCTFFHVSVLVAGLWKQVRTPFFCCAEQMRQRGGYGDHSDPGGGTSHIL